MAESGLAAVRSCSCRGQRRRTAKPRWRARRDARRQSVRGITCWRSTAVSTSRTPWPDRRRSSCRRAPASRSSPRAAVRARSQAHGRDTLGGSADRTDRRHLPSWIRRSGPWPTTRADLASDPDRVRPRLRTGPISAETTWTTAMR